MSLKNSLVTVHVTGRER